jgi:hypothetical protein
LKGAPAGVTLVAGPGSTANFDSAGVGQGKTISYTGYSLGGTDAGKYALASSCCGPVVARTTANITAPVVAVRPRDEATFVEATSLPETPYQGPTVAPWVVVPNLLPLVVLPATPPQLLALVPPAPPIVVLVEQPVENPVAQSVEAPPKPYLAPKRAPKQDRN